MVLQYPVIYLRRKNFESSGTLKVLKNKIVVCFIHSDTCPHCINAAPDFEDAATRMMDNKNVIFTAIQLNGDEPGENECRELIDYILPEYRGVPDYAFFKNGKPLKIVQEGRDVDSIIDTIDKILG